jgi:hypothetical protein
LIDECGVFRYAEDRSLFPGLPLGQDVRFVPVESGYPTSMVSIKCDNACNPDGLMIASEIPMVSFQVPIVPAVIQRDDSVLEIVLEITPEPLVDIVIDYRVSYLKGEENKYNELLESMLDIQETLTVHSSSRECESS